MAVHQRKAGQRLRSFTKSTAFLMTGTSSDADDDLGITGPAGTACFASPSSSSSTKAKSQRKPTATVRSRFNPPSKQGSPTFIPANALLISSPHPSSLHILPRKSISSPLLVNMQDQSPPPYTSLEFDLNFDDRSYDAHSRQRQPTAHSFQSVAGSSTASIPYPAPPLPYSSSASSYMNPSRVRRRHGTSSGSHPTSRYPSPTHSDSEAEDDAIYTTQRVRHRIPKQLHLHEGEGEESSSNRGTSHRSTSKEDSWSWRHWLFALAAGVVGLGDGRDDEREEKMICTTPGGICAGETETETDEPSRHLPTARIISPSESSPLPASTLEQLQRKLIPFLFEFSRLLSIVPAFFGTIWNLYWLIWPPSGVDSVIEFGGRGGRKTPPERGDFFVAALWSILTGYQCLALTTGLHTRWQTYYPPLATLIRLLALQGICWPATHVTLTVLDHVKRPVVCWCVVGTTTCFSRSVQIWVTSNISVDVNSEEGSKGTGVNGGPGPDAATPSPLDSSFPHPIHRSLTPHRPRFKWVSTERRWDWKEVVLKCVLPAGILYFVMAWVGELRRELVGC